MISQQTKTAAARRRTNIIQYDHLFSLIVDWTSWSFMEEAALNLSSQYLPAWTLWTSLKLLIKSFPSCSFFTTVLSSEVRWCTFQQHKQQGVFSPPLKGPCSEAEAHCKGSCSAEHLHLGDHTHRAAFCSCRTHCKFSNWPFTACCSSSWMRTLRTEGLTTRPRCCSAYVCESLKSHLYGFSFEYISAELHYLSEFN